MWMSRYCPSTACFKDDPTGIFQALCYYNCTVANASQMRKILVINSKLCTSDQNKTYYSMYLMFIHICSKIICKVYVTRGQNTTSVPTVPTGYLSKLSNSYLSCSKIDKLQTSNNKENNSCLQTCRFFPVCQRLN